jgi:hypothetical protein
MTAHNQAAQTIPAWSKSGPISWAASMMSDVPNLCSRFRRTATINENPMTGKGPQTQGCDGLIQRRRREARQMPRLRQQAARGKHDGIHIAQRGDDKGKKSRRDKSRQTNHESVLLAWLCLGENR